MQCEADYSIEGEVKYTSVYSTRQKPERDTDVSYHFYDQKGQLVRSVYKYGKEGKSNSAFLYYNEDGLPDSIRNDDPTIGTYVFQRKQKRKKKVITLETLTLIHKWVYNSSGQCISSAWASKRRYTTSRNADPRYSMQSASSYEYNPDGTLAKVVLKRDGKKVATLFYSYAK